MSYSGVPKYFTTKRHFSYGKQFLYFDYTYAHKIVIVTNKGNGLK